MAGYIGNRCVVPKCNSGYESSLEKAHLFSAPKDKNLLEKWQRAIPRKNFILKSGLVVCHKHFHQEEIIWKREVKDAEGKVMASEELKKPRLREGSVPSQFPNCPAYLSKSTRKRKPPKERDPIPVKRRKKSESTDFEAEQKKVKMNARQRRKARKSPTDIETDNSKDNEILADAAPIVVEQTEKEETVTDKRNVIENSVNDFVNVELNGRQKLFQETFANFDSVKKPTAWYRRQTEEGDVKCIEFTKSVSQRVGNKLEFVNSRQLLILDDFKIQARIVGVVVPLNKIGFEGNHASSVEDLENILSSFDEIKICSGCASPNDVTNVESTVAIRDSMGYLRHLKCPMVILNDKSICKFCANTKKVLANKIMRLKKVKKMKQLKLKLSNPAAQEKLKQIRKQLYRATKYRKMYKKKYQDCLQDLQKTQEQMASFSDDKLPGGPAERNHYAIA